MFFAEAHNEFLIIQFYANKWAKRELNISLYWYSLGRGKKKKKTLQFILGENLGNMISKWLGKVHEPNSWIDCISPSLFLIS